MCSYCGCESIGVIGRFMAEHDELINLSGPFLRAAADEDATALEAAAHRIEHLLTPHTRAEEAGLFDLLRREEHIADHIDELCAEHSSLDTQLAAVRAGDFAEAADFVKRLRNHMDREDNGLFPAAAIALDGPAWEAVDAQTPPRTP